MTLGPRNRRTNLRVRRTRYITANDGFGCICVFEIYQGPEQLQTNAPSTGRGDLEKVAISLNGALGRYEIGVGGNGEIYSMDRKQEANSAVFHLVASMVSGVCQTEKYCALRGIEGQPDLIG